MVKILKYVRSVLASLTLFSAPMAQEQESSEKDDIIIHPLIDSPPIEMTLQLPIEFLASPEKLSKLASFLGTAGINYQIPQPPSNFTQKLYKQLFADISAYSSAYAKEIIQNGSTRKFRILSLDGGGIRGFITCIFLSHLTHLTGRPIHDLFDMIIATSTGTLIAAGLATEKPKDSHIKIPESDLLPYKDSVETPYFSPEELAGIYLTDGSTIFSGAGWFGSLNGPKYPDKNLNATLTNFFGTNTLSDLKLPVFFTAYDLQKRKIITYSPEDLRKSDEKNIPICSALRACVAAPTIFAPVTLNNRFVCDAGIALNNPSALGLAIAGKYFKATPDRAILCSLGCGHSVSPQTLETYQSWGLKSWASELLETTFDGQTTDSIISMLHQATSLPYKHTRISPRLDNANMVTDVTTSENFKALSKAAISEIKRRENDFKKLAEALIVNTSPEKKESRFTAMPLSMPSLETPPLTADSSSSALLAEDQLVQGQVALSSLNDADQSDKPIGLELEIFSSNMSSPEDGVTPTGSESLPASLASDQLPQSQTGSPSMDA